MYRHSAQACVTFKHNFLEDYTYIVYIQMYIMYVTQACILWQYICILIETSSGPQEWLVVLLLQSCFLWSKIDHNHQATSTNDE